jgi:hypothetical protein
VIKLQGSTQVEKAMKIATEGIKKPKHPIYKGKFWIYEERRLASYNEWVNFYKGRENETNKIQE